MGTITKTVRIDEDFIKLVEDYCLLSKEMLGITTTVNAVLAESLVCGFNSKLSIFNLILLSDDNKKRFSDDHIKRCEDILNRYDYFDCMCSFNLATEDAINERRKK